MCASTACWGSGIGPTIACFPAVPCSTKSADAALLHPAQCLCVHLGTCEPASDALPATWDTHQAGRHPLCAEHVGGVEGAGLELGGNGGNRDVNLGKGNIGE